MAYSQSFKNVPYLGFPDGSYRWIGILYQTGTDDPIVYENFVDDFSAVNKGNDIVTFVREDTGLFYMSLANNSYFSDQSKIIVRLTPNITNLYSYEQPPIIVSYLIIDGYTLALYNWSLKDEIPENNLWNYLYLEVIKLP